MSRSAPLLRSVSVLALIVAAWAGPLNAATETQTVTVTCKWSRRGEPSPKLHWSPWLPIPYYGARTRFGFRFAETPRMNLKCPIRITATYDPAAVEPGKAFPITLTAKTLGAADYTFDSFYGIDLPNTLQIGLGAGIIGDIEISLGWWTLPVDFYFILGLIDWVPVVGQIGDLLEQPNIQVTTSEALPLNGETITVADAKDLIAISLTDLFVDSKQKKAKCQELAGTIATRASTLATTVTKWEKLASVLQNPKTQKVLAKGLGKAFDFLTAIKLSCAATYTVKGNKIIVYARSKAGTLPENRHIFQFTSANDEETAVIRIPVFSGESDNASTEALNFWIDRVEYDVCVRARLEPFIMLSFQELYRAQSEDRVQFCGRISTQTASDGAAIADQVSLSVPVLATRPMSAFSVGVAAHSASVCWATNGFRSKGTVTVQGEYGGIVARVHEKSFRKSHGETVTGLEPNTMYLFTVVGVSEDGTKLVTKSASKRTRAADGLETRRTYQTGGLHVRNAAVTAIGETTAMIQWNTDLDASTEVIYGRSPEYASAHVICAKRSVEAGDPPTVLQEVHRGYLAGKPVLGGDHTLVLTDLEPATKYYYSIISWTYKSKEEGQAPEDGEPWHVAEVANKQFTTIGSQTPYVVAKVTTAAAGAVCPGASVTVREGNRAIGVYTTDSHGKTEPIELGWDKTFTFTANVVLHAPAVVQRHVTIDEDGDLGELKFAVTPLQLKGTVVDAATGDPVAGCAVTVTNAPAPQPTRNVTTDANGQFCLDGFFPDGYPVQVAKAGYFAYAATCTVSPDNSTPGHTIPLRSHKARLSVSVTDDSQQAHAATVLIHDGATQQALSVGDSGKGTYVKLYGDSLGHVVTVTVTVAGANADLYHPSSEAVTLTVGALVDLPLVCDKKDLTAPVVAAPTVTQLTDASWKATWTTNEVASCVAEFLKGGQGTAVTQTLTPMGESHAATLTLTSLENATAGMGYKVRISATDMWNNTCVSGPHSVAQPDTTAPQLVRLQAQPISATSWSVNWTTDEPATCSIQFFKGAESTACTTTATALGRFHAATLNLANIGNPPAALGYKASIAATDAYGSTRVTGPHTVSQADTTAPPMDMLNVVQNSPTSWRVGWNNREDTTGTVKLYLQQPMSTQPLLTVDVPLGIVHAVDLNLDDVPSLPANKAQGRYEYEINVTDLAGNAATQPRTALPRDDTPPVFTNLHFVLTADGRWSVVWSPGEEAINWVEVAIQTPNGVGPPTAFPRDGVTPPFLDQATVQIVTTEAERKGLALVDLKYRASSMDRSYNTATSEYKDLDRGPRPSGTLSVPTTVVAGRPFEAKCQATSEGEFLQIWKIGSQEQEALGASVTKQLTVSQAGENTIEVALIDIQQNRYIGRKLTATTQAVESMSTVAVAPAQTEYAPGQTVSVSIATQGAVSQCVLYVAGIEYRAIAAADMQAAPGRQGWYCASVPYTIKGTDGTPLEILAKVEFASGATDERRLSLVIGAPDLKVDDLVPAPERPAPGQRFTLSATVRNAGGVAVRDCKVNILIGSTVVATKTISTLPKLGARRVSFDLKPLDIGKYAVRCVVDPDNEIAEASEANNSVQMSISVEPAAPAPQPPVETPTAEPVQNVIGGIVVVPQRQSYRAGQTIGLGALIMATPSEIAKCEFVVGGRSYQTVTGGTLRPLRGRQRRCSASVQYTIKTTDATPLEVVAKVTTRSGAVHSQRKELHILGASATSPEAKPTRPVASKAKVLGARVPKVEPPQPKPDVTVTALRASPSKPKAGQALTVHATVKNIGAANADDCTVHILVDGEVVERKKLSVPAKASRTLSARIDGLKPGRHAIAITADPDHRLRESNTANNSAEITVSVPGLSTEPKPAAAVGRPDIVVEKLALSPSKPKPGRPVKAIVVVRNIGNAHAAEVRVDIVVDQRAVKSERLSLPQGETRTLYIELGALTQGDHTIACIVDPDNRIAEPDERNNTAEIRVSLKEKPGLLDRLPWKRSKPEEAKPLEAEKAPSPVGRPDMVIQSIRTSPSEPNAGKAFKVYVSVKNNGSAGVDGCEAVVTVDGKPVGNERVSLPKGRSKTLSVQLRGLPQGDHVIRCVVDPSSRIDELDETNNRSEVRLSVTERRGMLDSIFKSRSSAKPKDPSRSPK